MVALRICSFLKLTLLNTPLFPLREIRELVDLLAVTSSLFDKSDEIYDETKRFSRTAQVRPFVTCIVIHSHSTFTPPGTSFFTLFSTAPPPLEVHAHTR
jgi:hypothetical protein